MTPKADVIIVIGVINCGSIYFASSDEIQLEPLIRRLVHPAVKRLRV